MLLTIEYSRMQRDYMCFSLLSFANQPASYLGTEIRVHAQNPGFNMTLKVRFDFIAGSQCVVFSVFLRAD